MTEDEIAHLCSGKKPLEVWDSIGFPTDDQLVYRAVRNAIDPAKRKGQKHPRWVAVMAVLALGSTYSRGLVRRCGLDPDEMVKR